jgi:hypothetical protein
LNYRNYFKNWVILLLGIKDNIEVRNHLLHPTNKYSDYTFVYCCTCLKGWHGTRNMEGTHCLVEVKKKPRKKEEQT